MVHITHPLLMENARRMLQTHGRLMGRLWGCRDPRLDTAEVYALDGKAWIANACIVAHMDWADFCLTTRIGGEWNVGPAGRVQVVASSRVSADAYEAAYQ